MPSSAARLGVCLATSGPGAIHLLNGLYDAKLDHQPVLAIVGQQSRRRCSAATTSRRSTSARCSRTSRTSTSTWRPRPSRCGTSSTAPLRIALGRAHGDLHHRAQRRAGARGREHAASRARHACTRASATRAAGSFPTRSSCERAADVLNAGERVAMLVGPGRAARHRRGDRGRRACSARASPRRCSARRRVPDDLPFVTGSIGLLGTHAELGADAGLRHAADGRLELPVLGVPARGGPGARRADRHRRPHARACATRWR